MKASSNLLFVNMHGLHSNYDIRYISIRELFMCRSVIIFKQKSTSLLDE